MDTLRRVAFETVLRACSFASLAIFCMMVGMSFDVVLAFKMGGFCTMGLALILVFKAQTAGRTPYKHTEWWLNIPDEARPPEAYAQWASTTVRREAFLMFAQYAAAAAVGLWALALIAAFLFR